MHEEHNHEHSTEPLSFEEALALLKYMAQHNAHHAEELHEAAHGLPENAALLLHEAVDLLNASTAKIHEVLALSEA